MMDTTTWTGATQVAIVPLPVSRTGGINDRLAQLHEHGAEIVNVSYHTEDTNHDPIVFIVYREGAS